MKYFQIIIYITHRSIRHPTMLLLPSFLSLRNTRCWNTISDHVFRTKLIEGCSKITLATFQGMNTPSPPFFSRNQAFIGMSSSVHHRARRCHHNVSCAPLISFEWWVDSSAGLLVKYRENSYSEEINLCRPMAAKMSRKKNKKRSTPRGRATPLSRYVHRSFTKKTQEKEDRGLP